MWRRSEGGGEMTVSKMTLVCVCVCVGVWVCVGSGAVVGGVQQVEQVEQVDSSGGSWRHNEFTAASRARAIALKPPVPPTAPVLQSFIELPPTGPAAHATSELAASAFARERSAGSWRRVNQYSHQYQPGISLENWLMTSDVQRPTTCFAYSVLLVRRRSLTCCITTARGGRSSE